VTQAALRLTPTDRDAKPDNDAAQLRAEHQRIRQAAQAAHGKLRTKLPGPKSKAGQALDARIAAALATRGRPWCDAMLAWRAEDWTRDPGGLSWSCEQVWSARSLEYAARAMAGQRAPPWCEAAPNPKAQPEDRRPASREVASW
jgi:hypothetical protein